MTRNHNEFAVVLKKAIRFVLPKVKPQVRQGNQQLAFSQIIHFTTLSFTQSFAQSFSHFSLLLLQLMTAPRKRVGQMISVPAKPVAQKLWQYFKVNLNKKGK